MAITIKIKNMFILWPNNLISDKYSEITAHVQNEICTRLFISVLVKAKVWGQHKWPPQRDKMKVLVVQSCPILCDPMDCSPPGSSVHRIFQARILEWVAILLSRGHSWPRDQTWVSFRKTEQLALPLLYYYYKGQNKFWLNP